MNRDALRQLPPVGAVLEHETLVPALAERGRTAVLEAVRSAIDEARSVLRTGGAIATDADALASRSREILSRPAGTLRHVINATGILLHTGLGRAPLAAEAIAAVAEIARGYCNLEFDLEEGTRGHRTSGIARLLHGLIGSAAATAVNNNAGATVLALRALASGRDVIVSRGQLVEIGGSFRLPEIFVASGAILREVGTTNKTRLSDYEKAIGPQTAAILRVHRSNFQIVGFTEEPGLAELVQLARSRGIAIIDDIGSGAIAPGLFPHLGHEPTAAAAIAAGVDLVLFSGDKLLGGPQCGVIAGTAKAVGLVERDPLMRALRLDKVSLAALEATLDLASDPVQGVNRIPLWSMMAASVDELMERASRLAEACRHTLGLSASALPVESCLGGGSAPAQTIPSAAVSLAPPFPPPHDSESKFARALRCGSPAVVPRVHKGLVLLDLRTVPPQEDRVLLDVLSKVCHDRNSRTGCNGPPLHE